ncbi:MAG: GPW/gp25 family protein [Roseicyclus sp.]
MTHIGFPFRIGPDGRTETVDTDRYVETLIELVLFTRRGERVHRAEFGAGAAEMVFSENAPEIAAAAAHLVQGALQQWLGTVIELRGVEASARDSLLAVTVRYRALREADERRLTVEGVP